METKQLIDKFINGDLTEEQFEAERAKLTPDDQKKLDKESESALPTAVERLKAVRRGTDKIAAEKLAESERTVASKMRDENFAEARSVFAKSVGMKEEDIAQFEEGFKKHDSGAVNVRNIVGDMEAYYASLNKDDYFAMLKEKRQREQSAEDIIAEQAGTGNGSGGAGGKPRISKEVEQFIKDSAKFGKILTPEQAERAIALAKSGGRIGI